MPGIIIPALLLAAGAWILGLVLTLLMGISAPDALSLFVLAPFFVISYGLGIWAATINIYLRNR
jgi:hypothetical protein